MITTFIDSLREKPNDRLFNPWFEIDPHHDAHRDSPEVRRKQFQTYLEERIGRARYLLIAEALGYQGGHFSGIAMTSERILLGHQREKYAVTPDHVFTGIAPSRTSKKEVNPNGMSEPTATIVWGSLVEMGIDPYEVVLWNAVPWHPYKPEKGLVSNRTPTDEELEAGLKLLPSFLELFDGARLVAVGRKCEATLQRLGLKFVHVRHPANGGAPKFRAQLAEFAGQAGSSAK